MSESKPSFILSVRFLLAIVAFLGYAAQYIQKIDMSVGIVCMVNNTGIKHINEEAAKKLSEKYPMSDASANVSVVNENCYFKELPGHKKMDGEFLCTKG